MITPPKINPENLPSRLQDLYHDLKESLARSADELEALIIKTETKLERMTDEN